MSTIHTIGSEWIQAITVEDRQDAIDGAAIVLADMGIPHPFEVAELAIDSAFKKVFRDG